MVSPLATTTRYLIIRIPLGFISFVSAIFVYRLFGPSELGKLMLVLGLVQGAASLVSFGTADTLVRFIIDVPKNIVIKLYKRAIKFSLLGLTITSLLWSISFIRKLFPNELRDIKTLAILLIFVYSFHYLHIYLLRGLGGLNVTVFLEGAVEVLPRLVILPFLFYNVATYHKYLIIQFATTALVAFCTIFFIRKHLQGINTNIESKSANIVDYTKKYWLYASNMLFGAILLMIGSNVSYWVIRYLLSEREVGLFALAARIPQIFISLFINPIGVPLIYYLSAEKDLNKRSKNAIQGTIFIALFTGIFCLILAGSSPIFIPFAFGNSYTDAIPTLIIYSFIPFCQALALFFNPIAIGIKRPQITNIVSFLMLLVIIAGNFIFVPIFQQNGSSIAVLIGNFFIGILFCGVVLRKALPGMFGIIIKLSIYYLPFALIASTSWWPLSIIGYPLVLILTRTIDITVIRLQIKNIILIIRKYSTQELFNS